jgi:hypothetical protein
MKGYEWIGWLATVFLGFTIINRILEGTWIGATDVAILNNARITQNVNFGFFSIPLPSTSYFQGILQMLRGDYSFFAGNAQIFYFFFQTVTFMIGFAMLVLMIGIAVNAIRTR